MSDQSDELVPPTSAGGESAAHNSVLIRTHEPARISHSWAGPAVLGVAIVIAGAIWGFMATHASGPVVNHAVGASPTTIVPSSPG
jgi:hypothetical protein